MYKVLLIVCILFSFSQAEDKEYVFKAKGAFAEELKTLMEKHAKEGKVEVEVVDAQSLRSNKTSMLDKLLSSKETKEDIAYGKKIYEQTCSACHGQKAEKSSYPNARILKTLSKEELVSQLRSYNRDADYGGSTKMIMNQQASSLVEEEMISLAAYIYTLK